MQRFNVLSVKCLYFKIKSVYVFRERLGKVLKNGSKKVPRVPTNHLSPRISKTARGFGSLRQLRRDDVCICAARRFGAGRSGGLNVCARATELIPSIFLK